MVFGPPAPARLPRDVLTQAGARSVILLEGINDIGGFSAKASDSSSRPTSMVSPRPTRSASDLRRHTPAVRRLSTLSTGGDYGTPADERQRLLLNRWIRSSGASTRSSTTTGPCATPSSRTGFPVRQRGPPAPGDAGYQKMAAETVDLRVLLGDLRRISAAA